MRMRHMRRRMMAAALSEDEEGFPQRVFRMHGGLRFYILWLLSGKRMNGSEIIEEIEGQTRGMWRPSPGSVYPLLKDLEKETLITRGEDGKYSISAKGKEQTEWLGISPRNKEGRLARIEDTLQQMESLASYLEDNSEDASRYGERLRSLKEKLERIAGGKVE